MNEFKVGDKVEVLELSVFYHGKIEVGDVATIVGFSSVRGFGVKCNNKGESCWISKSNIRLVTTKYPNSRPKHADVIIEWAKGANIELLDCLGYWLVIENPSFSPDGEYRVALTKKELVVIKAQAKIDKCLAKIEKLQVKIDALKTGGSE